MRRSIQPPILQLARPSGKRLAQERPGTVINVVAVAFCDYDAPATISGASGNMHIIARPAIVAAKQRHPGCANWLDNWWRTARRADWRQLAEVRVDYPSADQVGDCLVFDATGARRLICNVHYASDDRQGTLYVRSFLTHAEYDRDGWKDFCR